MLDANRMILQGKRSFYVLVLAFLVGVSLIGSVMKSEWTIPEAIVLLVIWLFLIYAGVVNFTADRIELTESEMVAKYKFYGFNWSKRWSRDKILSCSYDGSVLRITTRDGRRYNLHIQVVSSESERLKLQKTASNESVT